MAPDMLVQPVVPFADLAHCHVRPLTLPSGSFSVAVTAVPTAGCVDDRVTVPSGCTAITTPLTLSAVWPEA